MKKAVFFDLDGTLLPMDTDAFIRQYFRAIGMKMAPYGYNPKQFTDVVMKGCAAMLKNNGAVTNRELFWDEFFRAFPDRPQTDAEILDGFYTNEFSQLCTFASPMPELAQKALYAAREVADCVVLATSPVFPEVAVRKRLDWAGLRYEDFDYVSSYENSYFTKPAVGYFTHIMQQFSLLPENCVMVGNDMDDDIRPAQALGMDAFLVTDYIINRSGAAITCAQGRFSELSEKILHF